MRPVSISQGYWQRRNIRWIIFLEIIADIISILNRKPRVNIKVISTISKNALSFHFEAQGVFTLQKGFVFKKTY